MIEAGQIWKRKDADVIPLPSQTHIIIKKVASSGDYYITLDLIGNEDFLSDTYIAAYYELVP